MGSKPVAIPVGFVFFFLKLGLVIKQALPIIKVLIIITVILLTWSSSF